MRQTPNFTGWHAIVLHRNDSNTEKLARQLKLLGFNVAVSWGPLAANEKIDVAFVDADQGWDGLLPWKGAENAPCPVVALLGSEAPSRIAWAMALGAGAILAKPIATSAIFPALVMAIHIHEERRGVKEQLGHYEERIRMRPLIHRAVAILMNTRNLSESEAYEVLRSNAMRRRLALENVAAAYLAGQDTLPEVI
jgi:AmiR/NasT family two-component response regulator